MQKDLTIFIGRFSPFHFGHAEVLRRALSTSKAVLVLIGSADQAPNTKNPFTFRQRSTMIRDWHATEFGQDTASGRLIIGPLQDHPYSDATWIREVQNAVDRAIGTVMDTVGLNPKLYITGSNRDESTWYLKAFGDLFIDDTLPPNADYPNLSATQVRDALFSGRETHFNLPVATNKFLLEFKKSQTFKDLVQEYQFLKSYKESWKVKTGKPISVPLDYALDLSGAVLEIQRLRGQLGVPYSPVFVTVDAVVIQSGHVLVNIRDNYPGRGLWALPGGFIEENEKLIDAAVRELKEETSIHLSDAQLYGSIKSKEIFDKPDRSLRGRTITTAYLFKLDDSKPLPKIKPQKGEVQTTQWIQINEALSSPERWFEDHHAILSTMYSRV